MKLNNDEKKVASLYRKYQSQREVIDQNIYLSIRQYARDLLSQERKEEQIQNIINKANQMYLEDAENSVVEKPRNKLQTFVELPTTILDGSKRSIQKLGQLLTQGGLNKSLSGAFALVMLTIAIPYIVSSLNKSTPMSQYELAKVSADSDFILNEIQQSNDWQYGFSSSTTQQKSALSLGMLSVDSQYLVDIKARENLKETLNQVAKYVAFNKDEKTQELFENDEVEWKSINKSILNYYADREELALFGFGQWLEFHYLLSRISLENKNGELFNDNDDLNINLIETLKDKAVLKNEINSSDLDKIAQFAGKAPLQLEEIKEFSTLLLKIKTILKSG